jgi:hypothetical protein
MLDFTMILLGMFAIALWIIAATVLRAGCMFFRAPKPGFVGALTMVLLVAGATMAMQFLMGFTLAMQPLGLDQNPQAADSVRHTFMVPLHMLAAATIYKLMLPTSFGRAMLIWVAQVLMAVALFVVFAMVLSSANPSAWTSLRGMMSMP